MNKGFTGFLTLVADAATQSNTSDFTIKFYPNIELNGIDHEVCLKNITLYNSWYNISAALGNNTLRYHNSIAWKVITLDDGAYTVDSFNSFVQAQMLANGDCTPIGLTNVFDISFSVETEDGHVSLLLSSGYLSVDYLHLARIRQCYIQY